MDRIIVPLLVISGGALVWSNQTAVEILRSPTKVVILKPDPFPVVKFENVTEDNDETVVNVSVTGTDNNSSVIVEEIGGEITNTSVVEHSELQSTLANATCIRRDYEESAAAIFMGEAGPVEIAYTIFNSSLDYTPDNIISVDDVVNLKVLNETVVDCSSYLDVDLKRRLSPGALSSLVG